MNTCYLILKHLDILSSSRKRPYGVIECDPLVRKGLERTVSAAQ